MFQNFFLFAASFVMLWTGAGIAVGAISKIASSLRISSFFVSFFLLGLFTSITEIMVGINATIDRQPEIFAGNLIGSSVVVFLFVVPLLAILGNGVSLNHTFKYRDLVLAATVVSLPAILTLDGRISTVDALICIVTYFYFLYSQAKNSQALDRLSAGISRRTAVYCLAKLLVAVFIVFFASNILVDQTKIIASSLGVPAFIISLLVISLGTNIPEISIAARAVLSRKKGVAFGNYVGSASLNTLEMGTLSLFSNRPILAQGSSYSIIAFIVGLLIFLSFGKSRSDISRQEGMVLLLCYLTFVVYQLLTGPVWKW